MANIRIEDLYAGLKGPATTTVEVASKKFETKSMVSGMVYGFEQPVDGQLAANGQVHINLAALALELNTLKAIRDAKATTLKVTITRDDNNEVHGSLDMTAGALSPNETAKGPLDTSIDFVDAQGTYKLGTEAESFGKKQ